MRTANYTSHPPPAFFDARPHQVTKKFGKGKMGSRIYHKPYSLELIVAIYYLVRAVAPPRQNACVLTQAWFLSVAHLK